MKIVIIIALALLVLLDYAMCCISHDADERAERMYEEWKEERGVAYTPKEHDDE